MAVDKTGVPIDSADLADVEYEFPSGICTSIRTKEDNAAAVYAQAIVSFTPLLSLTSTLRGDYVRLPIEDLLTPENGGTSAYWRASPKEGLNYRLTEDVRRYVAFNTGFRAPAALELSHPPRRPR